MYVHCSAGKTELVSRDGEEMVMKRSSLLKIAVMEERMSNIAQEQRWYNPCLT